VCFFVVFLLWCVFDVTLLPSGVIGNVFVIGFVLRVWMRFCGRLLWSSLGGECNCVFLPPCGGLAILSELVMVIARLLGFAHCFLVDGALSVYECLVICVGFSPLIAAFDVVKVASSACVEMMRYCSPFSAGQIS